MKYYRAILKYYYEINLFNLLFCLLSGYLFGVFWAILFFFTIGIVIGLIGFQIFKKQEYYMYYNLGFTRTDLLKKVLLLHGCLLIPFTGITVIFI
ncbi:hypothetical protein ACFSTE_00800 [Aquimarina hainanensis]|uniref:Uncharacterized protein n=1 Tax=Aquimarina hainanensis TaxID=1578017 RepID=A0ABW5N2W2_9FLAO|nr:hypothetical protein [Aquimarina sp. TRL1]QKX04537.1 hypothetical protein HN014_06285 [Aquimarina sp. TRL1]